MQSQHATRPRKVVFLPLPSRAPCTSLPVLAKQCFVEDQVALPHGDIVVSLQFLPPSAALHPPADSHHVVSAYAACAHVLLHKTRRALCALPPPPRTQPPTALLRPTRGRHEFLLGLFDDDLVRLREVPLIKPEAQQGHAMLAADKLCCPLFVALSLSQAHI